LRTALEGAADAGAETQLLDLRELNLADRPHRHHVESATTDAVSYLGLTVLCHATLAALMRYKEAAVPLAAER
jgi:hypothetical protein